eukprot:CAMPEP_0172409108 /NCGR_PEP_ID=MMETSP1061-20121228/76194_1 /TAXON_ID=37318 /ORGANISM="Pseudo-nitzschia pungens, Strain cf. pungens" /LENGTH=81 /DNA_ID=CAMNT_0013145255 /DNA_START=3997 /DNA_END=4242 /DNA_ORIENTATION=-
MLNAQQHYTEPRTQLCSGYEDMLFLLRAQCNMLNAQQHYTEQRYDQRNIQVERRVSQAIKAMYESNAEITGTRSPYNEWTE